MLTRSQLNRRVGRLRGARERIGNYAPTDPGETHQQAQALAALNTAIAEAEQSLADMDAIEAHEAEQPGLAKQIKGINKTVTRLQNKRAQAIAETGTSDIDTSGLEATLQQRQASHDQNATTIAALSAQIAQREATTFAGGRGDFNTVQWCQSLAPDLEVDHPDVCNPGEHNETLVRPAVPDDEQTVPGRIAQMAAIADDRGSRFEVEAANQNLADGHITSGDQLSRGRTPQETAAGANGNDQHVFARCSKCGREREIDHLGNLSGTPTLFECKNKDSLSRADKDKMIDNRVLAQAQGMRVAYKFPPSQASAARIEGVENSFYGDTANDGTLTVISVPPHAPTTSTSTTTTTTTTSTTTPADDGDGPS